MHLVLALIAVLPVLAVHDVGLFELDTRAGVGGDLAGLPGVGYAKVLKDIQSGDAPVVSYWKPSVILSDNRLPAMGSYISTFSFRLPTSSEHIVVSAGLIFRRVFQGIADQKGWDIPDITMREITKTLSVISKETIYLPFLIQNP